MRKDMAKVVVERPRHGQSNRARRGRTQRARGGNESEGHELLVKRESIEAMHRDARKSFSDLLGPLRKFLGRRVGRRWDDVHSEMCAVLRGRSTTLQHILDHVKWFVAKDILFDERGKPIGAFGYPFRYNGLRPGQLYVDQKGFLRRLPFKARQRQQRATGAARLAEVITEALPTARLELRDGALWRVNQDTVTGAWCLRNAATARHAEIDHAMIFAQRGLGWELRSLLRSVKIESAYLPRLRELLAS